MSYSLNQIQEERDSSKTIYKQPAMVLPKIQQKLTQFLPMREYPMDRKFLTETSN